MVDWIGRDPTRVVKPGCGRWAPIAPMPGSSDDGRDAFPEADGDDSLQTDVRESNKLKISDEEVEQLRSQLSEADSAQCDAAMIRRFIRACGGDHRQVGLLGMEGGWEGGGELFNLVVCSWNICI